jgi:DNA transposition AAA+ family ATPase
MSDAYKKAGVTDLVKLVIIPEAKNHFILRLENIADLFDKDAASQTVDLQGLLDAMWKNANIKAPVDYTKMDIKEMSLTANMELKDMLARKIQWKTVDDDKEGLNKSKIDYDSDFSAVKLVPQRIRTYTVAFETKAENLIQ